MTLNVGDRLQNYEIRSTLGRGGFGMVYLAHDLNLDIDVAVKVIHAELSANEAILHRLRVGARTAAKLHHPNIQLVYYMGHDPASQADFVIMEYLPGGTLRQRLAAKNMPLSEALSTFTNMCNAMEFAHQHGVIHRDLKPENVMYTGDGRLVITDFDLAHVTGDTRRTVAGQMLGTIAYSSPEQIMGDEVTCASDIYSLGIMLFELVTGYHPFAVTEMRRAKRWGAMPTDLMNNPQIDLLQAQLNLMPPPPSEVNPAVPKHVDAALLKAMAKAPAERYQSAWELACAVNQQPYVTPSTPGAQAPREPDTPPIPAVPLSGPPVSAPPITPATPPAAISQARAAPPATPAGPPPATADATLRQTQKPALRVLNGPKAGQVFVIGSGLSLGNNKARNDIALDDSYASRAHAHVDRQGFTFTVTDLGSANGTKVNGRRLAPHTPTVLTIGDKIEVGYTLMQFELNSPPGPADKH
jgi:eukaryotic-like serine/threonine-protein kinase